MSSVAENASPTEVARRYFAAVAARDTDAMVACWAPGGSDRLVGQAELPAPDGVRAYFDGLFAAFPDLAFEVLTYTEQEDRCAVRWRARGTFAGPPSFQGLEATGASVEIEGCDVVQVADGLIHHNDAYFDAADMARQLGVLPPQDSTADQRMTALLNRKTRVARRVAGADAEPVADGVWVVRGGFPLRTMNVYLLEDAGGVTVFDAGVESMVPAIAAAAAPLGGIRRVVLGHGHADHRGAAPGLHAPTYCHPAESDDASADGGEHYFHYERLDFPARHVMPKLIHHWDGGPVALAGTVAEGDEIAGFAVVHLPGHAPGLIGLWRESDRLALVSDCFYTLDPQTSRKGPPRVPHAAFNQDTEQARASIRKLAAMEPAVAWAGHADPVRGDVRSALEHAAAAS